MSITRPYKTLVKDLKSMKKVSIYYSVIFCALLLSSCGSSVSDTSSSTALSNTSTPVPAASEPTPSPSPDSVFSVAEDDSSDSQHVNFPIVNLGEVVSIPDICDFSIESTNIADTIIPPQASGYYSYYNANEGKTLVDICIAYKNTSTSSVYADDIISGKLFYADKYEYTGFTTIEEDNRSDFTYTNISSISPLSTEYIHYIFEVPVEVQDSSASVSAQLSFNENTYCIPIRESSLPSSAPSPDPTSSPNKTSGLVSLNEIIDTSNSEFQIEFANISDTVIPPKASGYYSYYEADSGETYIDICFAYKNLSSKDVDADEVISAALKYANKYDYSGFSVIEEDNRGDFTYVSISQIAPLTTEYIHYLFEVPIEVSESSESIIVNFSVDGCHYSYTIR